MNEPDEDRAARARAHALADAAAELHAAIDELTEAVLRGTVIEKNQARNRFELALAEHSAQLEAA
jgi:hypothetical protein